MHTQDQQKRGDEINGGVKLSDLLVAQILAALKKRLHDDLPQLQSDPWARDQRGRGLHFDP